MGDNANSKKRKEVPPPEPGELTQIQQAPAKKPRLSSEKATISGGGGGATTKEKNGIMDIDIDYPSAQPVVKEHEVLYLAVSKHAGTQMYAFCGTLHQCDRVINIVELARKELSTHKVSEECLNDMFEALDGGGDPGPIARHQFNDVTLDAYVNLMAFTAHDDWAELSGRALIDIEEWEKPYRLILFNAN
jgi:hypothetical protein